MILSSSLHHGTVHQRIFSCSTCKGGNSRKPMVSHKISTLQFYPSYQPTQLGEPVMQIHKHSTLLYDQHKNTHKHGRVSKKKKKKSSLSTVLTLYHAKEIYSSVVTRQNLVFQPITIQHSKTYPKSGEAINPFTSPIIFIYGFTQGFKYNQRCHGHGIHIHSCSHHTRKNLAGKQDFTSYDA